MTPRRLALRPRSAAALAAALIVLAAAIRLMPQSYPTGDAASLSLHILAALRGRQYLGPYSQFGWSHPGPLLFYLMAPLYWMSGYHEASPRVMALLINAASLAGVIWIAQRQVSAVFAVLTALALVAFEWRCGGDMMFSGWNPHVTLLPLAALIFVSAAAWAGERRALPIAVLLASFVAQSHVGFVPIACGALLIALLAALDDPDAGMRRRIVTKAGWLGLLLWLPSLAEQLAVRPGNGTKLVRFFLQGQTGAKMSAAGSADLFAHYFVLIFRRRMHLPLGLPADGVASGPALAVAAALVAATLLVCALAAREGRRFVSALCGLCGVTSAIAFFSIGSIRGAPSDHMVFWTSLIGTLSVVGVLGYPLARVDSPLLGDRALRPAAWLMVAAWLATSSLRLVQWQQVASADRGTRRIFTVIDFEMRTAGAATAQVRHTASSWADVVGVVLEAEKRGRRLAVVPDLVHITGDAYAPTGREPLVFTVFDPARDAADAAAPSQSVFRAGRLSVAMQPLAPSR